MRKAGVLTSACVRAGAYNGSGHRQAIKEHAATELHDRADLLFSTITTVHGSVGAPPLAATLAAAKNWVAERLAQEAGDVSRVLPIRDPAFGGDGKCDSLDDELRREMDAANARLDAHWQRLERDRVERAVRLLAPSLVRGEALDLELQIR